MLNKRSQIKRAHTTWCHLCEVTEEAKIVIVIEIGRVFVSIFRDRKTNTKKHEKASWGDGKALYVNWGVCYTTVCNHQNS